MFNELMNEVNAAKKKQISANKGVSVDVQLGPKNVQTKKEKDEIEDMLANL